MRNIFAKLFIGATITAIGVFGADNSLGNWKLNLEKSTYNPGPPTVKSLTAARQASEQGVNAVSTGELANGDSINSTQGIKTPQREIDLIKDCLKRLKEMLR